MGKINKSLYSSKTGEWETPKELFTALDKHFHFKMDVAATKANAKCAMYLTKKDDALKSTWGSMNWCNPPYGVGLVKWLLKAAFEATEGRSTVMLLPARTDTKWFNVLGQLTNAIFLFHGRLTFDGEGAKTTNAPFPSLLAFFGINYADIRALKGKLNGEIWVIDKDYNNVQAEEKQADNGSSTEANG